jgi:hypothetical protein
MKGKIKKTYVLRIPTVFAVIICSKKPYSESEFSTAWIGFGLTCPVNKNSQLF